MYNGTMVVALTEVMPVNARVVGFSLAFGLATAVIGGLTPAISTYLIELTANKAPPRLWMSFAALCGLVATLILYRRGGAASSRKAPPAKAGQPRAPDFLTRLRSERFAIRP